MRVKNLNLKTITSFCAALLLAIALWFASLQYGKSQEVQTISSEILVRMLKVYKAYDENGALNLARVGRPNDGGYVVAQKSLDMADVCLGYGIADDISFEEQFSNTYNKPSFGFDCGVKGINISNKLCTFIPQCIASDAFIYKNQDSSTQLVTFSKQLSDLQLDEKKIFLKMDIEGAEYDAFEDIYKHADSITGIVLELHFKGIERTLRAIRLLAELQKDFVLINVHGNNYEKEFFTTKFSKGKVPKTLELTFVNKRLLTSYRMAEKQVFPSLLDMPNSPKRPDLAFEIID